jgi:hypothetical protein
MAMTGMLGLLLTVARAGAQGVVARSMTVETRVLIDEGPAEPVADLRDFAVGGDGRIYVLDGRLQVVHLYRANGAFEKTISRVGSGPGELRRANGLLVAPDQTLWVHDHGNNRISVFAADGTWLRQHRHDARSFGYRWDGEFDIQRRLITRVFSGMGDGGTYAWQRSTLDGRVLDTIPIPKPRSASAPAFYRVEFENRATVAAYPFREPVTEAFDPRGYWWSAAQDEYRLTRADLGGNLVATAARRVEPEPIPKALRDSAIRRIEASIKGARAHNVDFSRIPTTFAFVRQLVVDDQGRLWARRVSADSLSTTFDVFTSNGQFAFSAVVPERLSPFGRLVVSGDLLYAVALDEDDIPSIVKARLTSAR